jgi:dolichol-phosphate mannosyltransferase
MAEHGALIDISVVLPALGEADNLKLLLPRLERTLREMKIPFEILVIDAASALDDTELVCGKAGVVYCKRQGGNEYGDAVRTGISKARGRLILFMDADGSHSPEFIPNLYFQAADHEIVIASRYAEHGESENGILSVLMSHALNVSYRFFLGIPCRDVSNSFKLYRADSLKRLRLGCKKFDIIEEILFRIHENNPEVRISELPYRFKKRALGKSKRNLLTFALASVATLLRLRFEAEKPDRIAGEEVVDSSSTRKSGSLSE